MVDQIPDHKTMKKLARRHMEDFEPERKKKIEIQFLWVLIPIIICLIGVVIVFHPAMDIAEYNGNYKFNYVDEYGVNGAQAIIIGGVGVMIIGVATLLIIGKELDKSNVDWVDYYFENVYGRSD